MSSLSFLLGHPCDYSPWAPENVATSLVGGDGNQSNVAKRAGKGHVVLNSRRLEHLNSAKKVTVTDVFPITSHYHKIRNIFTPHSDVDVQRDHKLVPILVMF